MVGWHSTVDCVVCMDGLIYLEKLILAKLG